MVGRKKGFTARQSRRASRQMQNSTVGTHVRRDVGNTARRRANASSVSFSSSRGATGEIPPFIPSMSSRDGSSTYRQRLSQGQYLQERNRRVKRKRIVIGLVIGLIVLALAAAVGVFVFMGSIGSSMALRDSDARDALSAPKSGEPYYVLVTAELGAVAEPLDNGGPDVLLLVRVDEQNSTLAIISIPHNLQLAQADTGARKLSEISAGGDAALINAIEKWAEIDISHIVKLDEQGVISLIDALDGVDVTLTQELDDPHAGDLYFAPGSYTMSGKQAIVYLRATNITLGQRDQLNNQVNVALQIIEKLFTTSGTISFATRLDTIGSCFQTDYSSGDLVALADKFSGIQGSSISHSIAPGYVNLDTKVGSGGDSVYISTAAEMRAMIEQLESTGDLIDPNARIEDTVDPGSFTLEIQNGTLIVGAAAGTESYLTPKGFKVVEVGNAEQPIYDETLAVYLKPENAAAAKTVIDAIGTGRVIDGSTYYDFDADVLLIVGADYKPKS